METISVIIPTLNEQATIGRCLYQFELQQGPYELIVVDGGSMDNTLAQVSGVSAVTLLRVSPPGRARQMNRGAGAATGDILLFLHADTLLPEGGLQLIRDAVGQNSRDAGSFTLSFDHSSRLLDFFARCSRINHLLFTYGDQGLFVTRKLFEKIGGFAEIPLMEDVEIQQRLRKFGSFTKLRPAVVTAARRYTATGILRRQLINTCLVLLYHAGVSPRRLARYY